MDLTPAELICEVVRRTLAAVSENSVVFPSVDVFKVDTKDLQADLERRTSPPVPAGVDEAWERLWKAYGRPTAMVTMGLDSMKAELARLLAERQPADAAEKKYGCDICGAKFPAYALWNLKGNLLGGQKGTCGACAIDLYVKELERRTVPADRPTAEEVGPSTC